MVVTPNPRVHALFADKRNLALLSDPAPLRSWGVSADSSRICRPSRGRCWSRPRTREELWRARKKLFFKPAAGYGSKAVYRGDEMTKRVWGEIQRGGTSRRSTRRRASA